MSSIKLFFFEIFSGLGFTNASCELGIYSYEKHDYTKAKQFFMKASNKNHIRATFLMGACFEAEGFEKETVSWYCKSIDLGYIDAYYTLYLMYDGYFAEKILVNKKEAIKWLTKGAENGLSNCQCFLGRCYMNGDGVKVDYSKALEWLNESVQQGSSFAKDYLIELYRIIEPERIAKEGDSKAQISLGLKSIQRNDFKRAKYWINECFNNKNSTNELKEEAKKIWENYSLWNY